MIIFLLAPIASCALQYSAHEERGFIQWMRANNRLYSGDEYFLRLGIYLTRMRRIQEFNKAQNSFKMSPNHLTCLTHAEYKSLLGAKIDTAGMVKNGENIHRNRPTLIGKNVEIPESVDWREKGILNNVKDQGSCGSCWTFSAIMTMESVYALKSGVLFNCSEQNLLECDPASYGCEGGFPFRAVLYVMKTQNGMMALEEDYPYTGIEGPCEFNSKRGVGKITGYASVEVGDENDLKEKVAQYGPASVCIDAEMDSFREYSSGIYIEVSCSTSFLDHAVGCVGYGAEDGTDYWIIRNSWGPSWGEKGYMRMIRNHSNMCGVASQAIVALA
ncbi:Cathepsin L-like proteinase [Tritrichomonas foetus]|uniref:Cathepsin L-like proteinase n=1 Tax=Tritrichomonas foetus TaxID=1144522 RepID=A0A1J4KV36_9EUKA|nr:Cathepsin L-like proteinase [Tritrichomonas foetus]|eukprot:OHT15002.1 Cathepsin L-like proteinase [Tritrichomonas foetus]